MNWLILYWFLNIFSSLFDFSFCWSLNFFWLLFDNWSLYFFLLCFDNRCLNFFWLFFDHRSLNNFHWLWNRCFLLFFNYCFGNNFFSLCSFNGFCLLILYFFFNKFLWLLLICPDRFTLLISTFFHLSLYLWTGLILINFLSILNLLFVVWPLLLERFIIIYFFFISFWGSIRGLTLFLLLFITNWFFSLLLLVVFVFIFTVIMLEFQSSFNN